MLKKLRLSLVFYMNRVGVQKLGKLAGGHGELPQQEGQQPGKHQHQGNHQEQQQQQGEGHQQCPENIWTGPEPSRRKIGS